MVDKSGRYHLNQVTEKKMSCLAASLVLAPEPFFDALQNHYQYGNKMT